MQDFIASLPPQQQSLCFPAVADFAALREVQALAESLAASPPDIVIGCAGVATLPELRLTQDGYESQFAINHLAHWTLLRGLLPHLPVASRVVLVSSDVHKTGGRIHLDNLQGPNPGHL